jgi:hypothetical protein
VNPLKTINKVQVSIGIASLLFGYAFYVIRSPSLVYIVPNYFSSLQLPENILILTNFMGNQLPDAIHPFAFILITSGLLYLDNKIIQFFLCIGWFFLECFFELGQLFKEHSIRIIPSWFEGIPFLENTTNFFSGGTFDVNDLLSFLVGSVAAFYILIFTSKRRIVG